MRNLYDQLKAWLTGLAPNTANLILIVGLTVAATFVVGYLALDPNANLDLSEGDVAPGDIRAPADSSFESAILTENERQQLESCLMKLRDQALKNSFVEPFIPSS